MDEDATTAGTERPRLPLKGVILEEFANLLPPPQL